MIERYDPFQDFSVLKDAFRSFENSFSKQEEPLIWKPKTEIAETDKNIVLCCELPGVEKNNIKIDVSGDTLCISGEKKFRENPEIKYHHTEINYGPFSRTFKIGIPVETENIKATYREGLLEITLPKAEKTAQKKIEITS